MLIDRELVRQARQQRGWTQQQLAELSDLSIRTIQRVENQGVGSHETVAALCSVFEIERGRLLSPQQEGSRYAELGRFVSILAAIILGMVAGSLLTLLFSQ